MTFTVMITTRNRCDDLRRTCRIIREWNPAPLEVIIMADGCTDGTAEMVRNEFPAFCLYENPKPLGSVASRKHLLEEARGDGVVSLDDDSYPVDRDFLARLMPVLEAHPEAAVVAFPELRDDGSYASSDKTPETPGHYVSSYANCAAMMRREFYLRQPGFPRFFVHMYEEPDYALQCYAAGAAVWFEPSLVIRHHMSLLQRQPVKRHHQNARNELWSVWMRCPWPWLPVVALFRIWRQFRYACREGLGWACREPVWWFDALRGLADCWKNRQPVDWKIYFAWMRLARHPVAGLSELKTICGRAGSTI